MNHPSKAFLVWGRHYVQRAFPLISAVCTAWNLLSAVQEFKFEYMFGVGAAFFYFWPFDPSPSSFWLDFCGSSSRAGVLSNLQWERLRCLPGLKSRLEIQSGLGDAGINVNCKLRALSCVTSALSRPLGHRIPGEHRSRQEAAPRKTRRIFRYLVWIQHLRLSQEPSWTRSRRACVQASFFSESGLFWVWEALN